MHFNEQLIAALSKIIGRIASDEVILQLKN